MTDFTVKNIIQWNYAEIVLTFFLLIFLLTDKTFSKDTARLFLSAIIATFVLIISDNIDLWLKTFSKPHTLRWITSATGYTLRPTILFFITLIIRRRSAKEFPRSLMLTLIPLAVNSVLCYTTSTTRLVFLFDEHNDFQRSTLGYLPFAVSAFYMILMVFWSIKAFYTNAEESIIVFVIAAISVAATVLESIFKYHLLLNKTIAISLVFYFLYLHVQIYKRDALTDVLNRRSFYLDIQKYSHEAGIIVSMDLNNLKKINDTQGHLCGDEALKTIVACMLTAFKKSGLRLYRTGGDEFMALAVKKTKRDIAPYLQQLKNLLQKTPYRVACGSAEFAPGENFEHVINISDKQMYKHKAEMKKTEA